MAEHSSDPFIANNNKDPNDVFEIEMGSDAAFTATPANTSQIGEDNTTNNPTFIQNQLSIQRSSSTAAAQASALSRSLSIKSNGSPEIATGPTIAGVLDDSEDRVGRGRGRGDSASSLIAATTNCTLTKSPSVSTNGSTKSVKSSKSVRSVHAVGSFPLGSLRVHSPSPTRPGAEKRAFLKSGDVVIIRDIPPGSLIGFDTRGFAIKEKGDFEGIKAIPAGAHFLWGGSSTGSLRNGFWIMTSKKATDELGEIHVRRWDKEKEILDEVRTAFQLSRDTVCSLLKEYASALALSGEQSSDWIYRNSSQPK
jgi:A1 cistron-splicing factor AAR2